MIGKSDCQPAVVSANSENDPSQEPSHSVYCHICRTPSLSSTSKDRQVSNSYPRIQAAFPESNGGLRQVLKMRNRRGYFDMESPFGWSLTPSKGRRAWSCLRDIKEKSKEDKVLLACPRYPGIARLYLEFWYQGQKKFWEKLGKGMNVCPKFTLLVYPFAAGFRRLVSGTTGCCR